MATVDQFWRFVCERHEVFRRRVLCKWPPPWSADPILNEVKFTNVYRDLDRVTLEFLSQVPKAAPAGDVLFNVVLYRFFNWPATYYALGGWTPAETWDGPAVARILRDRRRHGFKIFTGAFLVQGGRGGAGSKLTATLQRIAWVRRRLPALTRDVMAAATARQAHTVLTRIPGAGGFLAQEFLIDLCYPETRILPERFLDEWVFIGPGALKGLMEIAGERVSRKGAEALLRLLRDNQDAMIAVAGAKLHGPKLTLENLENCCCEFSKYRRVLRGGGAKAGFNAQHANLDLSPWNYARGVYRSAMWPLASPVSRT